MFLAISYADTGLFFISFLYQQSQYLQSDAKPLCISCGYHKPEGTHHCSLCGRCVLYMDHHCVWINQCVGLNNHRYFLQFVIYVWFSQCFILTANYTAFWEHFYAVNVCFHLFYIFTCTSSI